MIVEENPNGVELGQRNQNSGHQTRQFATQVQKNNPG